LQTQSSESSNYGYDILGMDSPAKASWAWTLEEEVDAYLLDTSDNNDIVKFWEVRMHPAPFTADTLQKKLMQL